MMKQKGFTLIELLVVVAIIGILASVVMASLNSARDKAKYAKVKKDIQTIHTAMLLYQLDVGELPPRNDFCNTYYCGGNPTVSSWTVVIDALLTSDGPDWNGPYLVGRIDKDPWENYFGYDDNDIGSGQCADSIIYSVGADKVTSTSDDYYVILPPTLGAC